MASLATYNEKALVLFDTAVFVDVHVSVCSCELPDEVSQFPWEGEEAGGLVVCGRLIHVDVLQICKCWRQDLA